MHVYFQSVNEQNLWALIMLQNDVPWHRLKHMATHDDLVLLFSVNLHQSVSTPHDGCHTANASSSEAANALTVSL